MYLLQDAAGGNHVAEATLYKWSHQEADLVDWWIGQSERQTDLRTSEGEHLVVVDAGVRNDGPGPDVFNSHIILGDLELFGDVEMHWHGRDWFSHHHDQDIKYANVVLHVVMKEDGGPDLATLCVPPHWTSGGTCSANRPITSAELVDLAWNRFHNKINHINRLAETGLNPLLLGMVEIICAGKQRHKQLHHIAVQMGLMAWPDAQRWCGSNQSFTLTYLRQTLVDILLKNPDPFNPENWQNSLLANWVNWRIKFRPLLDLGFSQNQVREWVVNILVPYKPLSEGFEFWVSSDVFRHYGFEKQVTPRLGIEKIHSIAEQQALLEWQNQYCSNACTICPLSRSIRY